MSRSNSSKAEVRLRVPLVRNQRDLLLDIILIPEHLMRLIRVAPVEHGCVQIRLTLEQLDELVQCIEENAQKTTNKKAQKTLYDLSDSMESFRGTRTSDRQYLRGAHRSRVMLGLVFGRKDVYEGMPGLIDGDKPMRKLVKAFHQKNEGFDCAQITGTDLADPEMTEAYFGSGGLEHCAGIMADTAGYAAELIYDHYQAQKTAEPGL